MLKRTAADKWFSDCVRMRANWTCERCGKSFPGSRQGLDCSHIIGRGHRSTRFDPANAQALCMACHNWYGDCPPESGPWVRSVIGDSVMDYLVKKKHTPMKINKATEKLIAAHYRAEFRRMQALRDQGQVDRIEFEPWDGQ